MDTSTITKAFELQHSDSDFFEKIIEDFYYRTVSEGDNVIDVGGNYGRHAFELSKVVGFTGMVFVVEPIPELVLNFLKVIAKERLDNIRLLPVAVAEVEEISKFFVNKVQRGLSGLRNRCKDDNNVVEIFVQKTLLDWVIPHDCQVKFIKIDVEGAEFLAMLGAKRILQTSRPIIVFEFEMSFVKDLYNLSIETFFNFFDQLGYRLVDLFGREFSFQSSGNGVVRPWYYIAAPSEQIELISKTLEEIFHSVVGK